MKERKRIGTFFGGFVTALALTACLTTALAASGKVSYNFANVALDGTRKITAGQDITAANGQKVPGSILYTDEAGGKTNYLPIRTISELLGVEIGYDSATKTVLLGKQPTKPAAAPEAQPDGSENVIDLRTPKTVPENPRRGDTALIKSRGGTILPDDDPNSYRGNEKMFKDKNGQLRYEYMVGNDSILTDLDKKAAEWSIVDGVYPKNKKGESYGSLLLADYVGYAPDLTQLGDEYIRQSELQAASDALNGLPEKKCPHTYSIPLYNKEGEIIGEHEGRCQGHFDGMTLEEAQEAVRQNKWWQ